MYSTCNQAKPVVGEIFIKTLKNNIYKHMAVVSKNFILMFYMILFVNTITHFIELLA